MSLVNVHYADVGLHVKQIQNLEYEDVFAIYLKISKRRIFRLRLFHCKYTVRATILYNSPSDTLNGNYKILYNLDGSINNFSIRNWY